MTPPRHSPCVVGVDIGASSCKATVVDAEGRIRGIAQQEYSRNSPKPGWVELDTKQWWDTVAATVKRALKVSSVPPSQINGLGVSSEADGIVPVGDDGEPLRPYIHWSDTRCYPQYDWILSQDIEEIYRITGIPLHRSWESPAGLKMLWIKENEPDVFAKTQKFLNIGNYAVYKLTGRYRTDFSVAARTMLLDIRKLEWSEHMAAFLEIPLSKQPTLGKSATIVGKVTDDASRLTGLSPDTQVVTGGADGECGALGAGLISGGQALVVMGTAVIVLEATENPPFLSDRKSRQVSLTGMYSSCHVVDGIWLLEAASMGGGRLAWFKKEFGHLEDRAANQLDISAYDVLCSEAKRSKPGPNSPVFVSSNNAIFNLTVEHKRADVIRSILEGAAFEVQQILEAAEGSGIEVKNIIMVGGGGKSDVWRSILADVTNKLVRSPDLVETASLGGAILAGLGTGVYESVEKVPRLGTHSENTPDPRKHETYRALYQRFKTYYELSRAQP